MKSKAERWWDAIGDVQFHEMTFFDAAFDILDLVQLGIADVSTDWHDASVELYGLDRPKPEDAHLLGPVFQLCRQWGFALVYLNYVDGWAEVVNLNTNERSSTRHKDAP